MMQQHSDISNTLLIVQLVSLSLVNLRWSFFFYMLLSLQVYVGQILVALDLGLEIWWPGAFPVCFRFL